MSERDEAAAAKTAAAKTAAEKVAAEKAARAARIDQAFNRAVPYNAWLGLETVDVGEKGAGRLVLRLPFREELVGNPETGVLHGGVITAAMDATSGGSVFLALAEPLRIATLDLRIDYLRPAEAGRDVLCSAHCYRVSRQVAFTRGVAHHGDPGEPIAHAVGTFMIFRDAPSRMADALKSGRAGEGEP
ncbi:MAG TPA: PaaI family thioesterase [Polyangiaceae bacterium LLY-WYZ-15_(1-7)]|nr:thioesterase [Sandaracinus sp.]HJK93481.1 PaaI family thioesterase [Polyangiaceae bacterium LLY-WYZ-15_(1-7)]HJL04299.1 PaaI family thioesterase [Polyangiaceae bacterium LLY-WYZ-15_(1-7)]HJL10518.1 PaaI family thioesterase [Polyangiaceae bacterium LLY-WYZ-15_(1-7)]HJL23753.1 PaaI family thioesterase [Polyangiaceae bacterium LLY-WYZ-15_(1-7)]